MADPLEKTGGNLEVHWRTLEVEISRHLLAETKPIKLNSSSVGQQTIATLAGEGTRLATRLRGQKVPVAPFCAASSGWNAWLGYREVWSLAANQRFAFSSADLTIFVAPETVDEYQQLLRAEWVGVSTDGLGGWAFSPPDAGHPHWQMDIGEALQRDGDVASALDLLKETAPMEFGAAAMRGAASFPWMLTGRMHLASAMRPWSDAEICHGPRGLNDIRSWVTSTIKTLRTELRRL